MLLLTLGALGVLAAGGPPAALTVQGEVAPTCQPLWPCVGDAASAHPGPAAPWDGGGCSSPAGSGTWGGGSARPKLWLLAGGMAAGGHGGSSRGVFGREPCPGGARCRAGRGVGAAGGTRGQQWLFRPILLCPAPAHRDTALSGLRELGSGWMAPTERSQGGGAEGAESFPAWTHLGTLVGVLLLFPRVRMCLPSKIFHCSTDCTCGSSELGLRFLPCHFKPENPSFRAGQGQDVAALRCS